MTRRIVSILGVAPFLLAFMLGAACASYPPPTDAVANALASMRGAEELGASREPPQAAAAAAARRRGAQTGPAIDG